MKILAVADVESRILYDHFTKERVEGVELIVSCGDLKPGYLDFLITMVNVPMLYVRGNHDDNLNKEPPAGAICIEDKIYNYKGIRFMGLGGSMKYRKNCLNMYSETHMQLRAARLAPKAAVCGVDVLVTHAPAKGYGDLEDLPHHGFETFNNVMNRYRPAVMLHGHVHTNYGRNIRTSIDHPSGTKIINACGYQIIDIPEHEER
ncbi:MAG: metallophosphoesterase family protein [Clostridiales bacterium]|nr:metallophosphoesterase family protein [Clostridiales bacterium]